MKDESLEKTLRMIILHLDQLWIDEQDKTELMINLSRFLSPNIYEENIKILKKEKKWEKN